MKILFCSPCSLSRELGAAKVIFEIADQLEKFNYSCTFVSPDDVRKSLGGRFASYPSSLRYYLQQNAADYDVVDYDHAYLPYPRTDFPPETLLVARSVLLRHHFLKITIPRRRFFKSRLRQFSYGWWLDPYREGAQVKNAQRTMLEADLVNVMNGDDRTELIRSGIPEDKIVVIGHGLTAERFAQFSAVDARPLLRPTVVFVGTFDARKGSVEMPQLFKCLQQEIPTLRFRLLGGRRSVKETLKGFPTDLKSSIEVVPDYPQDKLPNLLASASIGIFPSRIEGFGIGILEMLAASLPVIAYKAPGPSTILPNEWLVPGGDYRQMAAKVVAMLKDDTALIDAKQKAQKLAETFRIEEFGKETARVYSERVEQLRRNLLAQSNRLAR